MQPDLRAFRLEMTIEYHFRGKIDLAHKCSPRMVQRSHTQSRARQICSAAPGAGNRIHAQHHRLMLSRHHKPASAVFGQTDWHRMMENASCTFEFQYWPAPRPGNVATAVMLGSTGGTATWRITLPRSTRPAPEWMAASAGSQGSNRQSQLVLQPAVPQASTEIAVALPLTATGPAIADAAGVRHRLLWQDCCRMRPPHRSQWLHHRCGCRVCG